MSLCWHLTYSYNKTTNCRRPELIYLFEHAASHDPWRLANPGNETNNTSREGLFSHQTYNSFYMSTTKRAEQTSWRLTDRLRQEVFPCFLSHVFPPTGPRMPADKWECLRGLRHESLTNDGWGRRRVFVLLCCFSCVAPILLRNANFMLIPGSWKRGAQVTD